MTLNEDASPVSAAGHVTAADISVVMAGEDVLGEARACLAIYGPVVRDTHSSLEYEVPSEEVRE